MDQRNLACKIGQKQRLFHGCISTADDNDFLSAVKEAVAGSTGRNAKSLELFFGWQAKPFGPRPRGKDHRVGSIGRAAIALGYKGPLA